MRSYLKYSFCLKNVLLSGKHISHTNSSVKLKIKLSFTECEGKKWIRVTILMEVNLQRNIVLMAVVFLLLFFKHYSTASSLIRTYIAFFPHYAS